MSARAKPPIVSAVLTVYNKAAVLPDTIRSLRRQTEDETAVEYVFVDDASDDESVVIIRDMMADVAGFRIIENSENRGPSVRLNQGVAAASGDFLYFLDGDDIAVQGAMCGMLRLLQAQDADFIYGNTAKKLRNGVSLLDLAVDPGAPFSVSDRPLEMVLGGGFVRMALMCRRDVFLRAGGADERIFVQDESLPLRLAACANRMIRWQAEVIAQPQAPQSAEKISRNKSQLHHDAFLAFRHALDDVGERFPDLAPKLFAKAVSAYWKYAKRRPGPAILKPGFWRYLQVKSGHARLRPDVLAWMQAELAELDGIRRM